MTINKEDIAGYECKHAVYCRPPKYENDDYHFVKERIHLKDGTSVPNVRMIKNYKRNFWVTKKGKQVHKQKKERELLVNLDRYECTESELIWKAAKVLGQPYFRGTLRELNNNPYLYGTDIFSTALIKGEYRKKYGLFSQSTVACFDIETSMVDNTILMATLSFKSRVVTAIRKDFLEGHAQVELKLQEAFDKYLGKYKQERNIDWEVLIVDEEIDIVKEVFKRAHEWKPDFLAIWNINFDLPKVLEACERAKVNPADIFSDPIVPPKYRFFRYKEGTKTRVMASGKVMPIGVADQWHVVFTPSSFYFIDSMCCYRKLRVQRGELPRYSLDYVLNLELGERKLRFEEANKFSGAEWHSYMQDYYPVEYVVYNVFDCIGMELLDEKVKDLAVDIPTSCEFSDYRSFESQPKRVIDELHYFLLEDFDSVIGSTGSEMLGELDKLAPANTDLIVNLRADLITEEGLHCIEGFPTHNTRIYTHTYDLDVSASYPSNTIVTNMSKETCRRILCRIEGHSEYEMRMATLNFSGGHTNSLELCQNSFKLPNHQEALTIYKQKKKEMQ